MNSRFGVNSHVAPNAVLETLIGAGIRWHRVDFDWPEIEPVDHDHRWSEVDRVVATINRLSGSVLGVIAYTPAWASGHTDRATPPRDRRRYADFVHEVATRYPAGHIAALSIWNEPNVSQFWGGSRNQYLELLDAGLAALKASAPGILAVGPDLSSSPSGHPTEWLARALEAADNRFDVISHHQYDGGDTVRGRVAEIDRLRTFLQKAGHSDTPLWITEIGWDRSSPQEQAAQLRAVMEAMNERPWWAKTFWYDSHGPKWGLLKDDLSQEPGEPKPAFLAYRELISKTGPTA